MNALRTAILRSVALFISCLAFGGAALAAPQSGWWWNPNEGGRGFFVEVVGDWMFFSAYFYDTDGRPTWLVSNDPMPDPNVYEGRLLAFAGGQSLTGDYRAPGGPALPGNVKLEFTDERHARMTWPGGIVAIERYDFNTATGDTFRPQTGWWWNPNEGGRGFSIELQGSHMFIGAYMYDEGGNPVWYVADAQMATAQRFAAPLLRFSGGQTLTGSYHPATGPTTAGSIVVDFASDERATVTLSDSAAPGVAAKKFKTFSVETQKKKKPPSSLRPDLMTGEFTQRTAIQADLASGFVEIKANVTWRKSDLANIPDNGATIYIIQGGQVEAHNTGQVAPGDNCSGAISGDGSYTLQPRDGSFDIFADGHYTGNIAFTVNVTSNMCGIVLTNPFPISIPISGVIGGDGMMVGNPLAIAIQNGVTVNHWSFGGG